MTPGVHRLTSTNNVRIGAYIYGVARECAYAYPAGMCFSDLTQVCQINQFVQKKISVKSFAADFVTHRLRITHNIKLIKIFC